MDGHKQSMHMKNRQGMNQHIAALGRAAPAPAGLEHLGVTQQIGVRQHGALASPGGAAGVEDGGQIIRAARHHGLMVGAVGRTRQQGACAVVVEGKHMSGASLKGDFADPSEVFASADHHRGLGIVNEILDFRTLISRVQGQKHQTGAQSGEVEQHRFDRLFDLHRHPSPLGQL